MEWIDGWSGLLEATGGFHDGVVHGMDLSSQSYVRDDLALIRPSAPADVRLLVQLQNAECPAILIDFVDVLECGWSNRRNVEWREPEPVHEGFKRYEILEFAAIARSVHWMRLDKRTLGEHAARIRRASD